jgi:TrmH family RNA methyltransferase
MSDAPRGGGDPARITSLTNPRIKAAVRLRDRRERDATGRTIVDGIRELSRSLDAAVELETVFVAPDLIRTPEAETLVARAGRSGMIVEVSAEVLGKLAFGDRSDGVVAIVRTPSTSLDDLVLSHDPLVVVVESVEKPGNLGAIVRSADGAGASAVIAASALTDVFNPNAIRASLGTIFALPIGAAGSAETLAWLIDHGFQPVAAVVDAPTSYTDVDLSGPTALVLGNEASGLGGIWRDPRVVPVSLPMAGVADSLNVSTAAAILLYEAVRQRAARRDRFRSDPAH